MNAAIRTIKYLILIASLMLGLRVPPSAQAMPDSFLLPEIKTDHPAMSNVDILIDVGHGGIDGGTSHGNLLEKDINLAVAKKTYDQLRQSGYTVLINRMDDYALSGENKWLHTRSRHIKDLAQRAHLANEVSAKAVISIHVNSAKRPAKRGAIMLHQQNERSQTLANALQQSMNAMYEIENEPVLGKTYYLLKHIKSPAVIVEMGFITNGEDRELMRSEEGQQKLAAAIAAGTEAYLKDVPPSSEESEPPRSGS
ncbi:N-acetylmuramoyl-L-alanine amidase [Paenibacillus sp. YYML68]|uniref:N-acetylmuramoyl-L-alanine amidase family protein n=1 Tax=Paenibacillus sp. YYML68 TaxID=2909250 RepID=UPI00248FF8FE|nr:N-acetylmuramoyl-L-alanine amidase [Paenibacillus sp. YYML68]